MGEKGAKEFFTFSTNVAYFEERKAMLDRLRYPPSPSLSSLFSSALLCSRSLSPPSFLLFLIIASSSPPPPFPFPFLLLLSSSSSFSSSSLFYPFTFSLLLGPKELTLIPSISSRPLSKLSRINILTWEMVKRFQQKILRRRREERRLSLSKVLPLLILFSSSSSSSSPHRSHPEQEGVR